jgi:hypothetical protein
MVRWSGGKCRCAETRGGRGSRCRGKESFGTGKECGFEVDGLAVRGEVEGCGGWGKVRQDVNTNKILVTNKDWDGKERQQHYAHKCTFGSRSSVQVLKQEIGLHQHVRRLF